MLYATASHGVFRYDPVTDAVSLVLSNTRGRGLFRRSGRGFFGLCLNGESGELIVASRERLGTRRNGKSATDAKLHALDPRRHTCRFLGTVRDVHDIHQIAWYAGRVFLTDTGKNRVQVYDLRCGRVTRCIHVGETREDINHVNAVLVHDGCLYVGLNNRGASEAEILRFGLDKVLEGPEPVLESRACAGVLRVSGVKHSHDLMPYDGSFLVSASQEARVVRADTGEAMLRAQHWTRGLAAAPDGLWVGTSPVARRPERMGGGADGSILRYNRAFELVGRKPMLGAGQINDMLWLQT